MSGMSGGSMLRTRRKDVNVKPNRKLDRKSSRGMLYENEELRLRTININAEVERGQSDIKKLKRENDQLKREISSLRYEYDKLDKLLRERVDNRSSDGTEDSDTCCSDCEEKICKQNDANSVNDENSSNTRATGGTGSLHVAFNNLMVVPEEGGSCDDSPQNVKDANVDTDDLEDPCECEECVKEENIPDQTASAPQPSDTVKTQYCDVVMPYEGPSNVDSSGIVAPIFPKQGLDILINNNNNIFSDRPPIGFIIPHHNQFMGNRNIVPYVNENEHRRFQTGGNVEDLLGDIESSNVNLQRDAIVLFNTKKVIQQHTYTNEDRVLSSNREGIPYFVTEKNIDLNYDYPKTAECSKAWLDQEEKQCKSTTTQTTLTTTEINSTVFMIDRPKTSKNMQFFSRSHSAPVEPIVEEPIYATVKKLPKKLRMVDLTNLEEEVAYNPSVDGDVNVNIEEENNKEGKEESASVSSSQPESSPKPKKSSMKKKRFSIYFKRRSKASESVKTKEEQKIVSISTERLEGASESDTQKRNCTKNRSLREPRPSVQGLNTPPNGHACGADHKKPHKCSRRKKSIRSDSIGKHKYSPMRNYFKQDSYQEMTTSHSERERTNSLSSSGNSGFSVNTRRKISVSHPDGKIPWCGCWGNSCL